MANRIQVRRDTETGWTTANPVLADGEPGYEKGAGKVKFGDGVTPWVSLPYASEGPPGPTGGITLTPDPDNPGLYIF